MRKFFILLAAAAGLSGCMTGEDSYDSADIKYREIRVDAFTHYWEMHRRQFAEVAGDTLRNGDYALTLVNRSLVKASGLPKHTFDTVNGYSDLFFAAKAPENGFSCTFESRQSFEEVGLDSADLIESSVSEGDTVVTGMRFVADARAMVRPFNCEYVPGKGFRLNSYRAGGTYVIRY